MRRKFVFVKHSMIFLYAVKSANRSAFQSCSKNIARSKGASRYVRNKKNITRVNRRTADHESRERLRASWARYNKRQKRWKWKDEEERAALLIGEWTDFSTPSKTSRPVPRTLPALPRDTKSWKVKRQFL